MYAPHTRMGKTYKYVSVIIPKNPTAQQKKMWDPQASAMINNKDMLRQNMRCFCSITIQSYNEGQDLKS